MHWTIISIDQLANKIIATANTQWDISGYKITLLTQSDLHQIRRNVCRRSKKNQEDSPRYVAKSLLTFARAGPAHNRVSERSLTRERLLQLEAVIMILRSLTINFELHTHLLQ